ncbi:MAG: CapA family protein, partial [Acetatifactor sp.]|nr:CapA family protein [Acetatifactor sp.]
MRQKLRKYLYVGIVVLVFLLCYGVQQGAATTQRFAPIQQSEQLQKAEQLQKTEQIQQSEQAPEQKQALKTGQMQELERAPQSAKSPKEQPQELSLVMVGDILLHTRVEESAKRSNGSYNFSAIFSHVKKEIRATDLALVNQEVILGGKKLGVSGYPAFNAPYEIGDALAKAGFDVVCHATNHALDKRKQGILNCLDFWRKNYPEMAVLGIYDNKKASEKIYYYKQNGIRVAILNYTYGTNGISMPKDMPYAVSLLEKEKVKKDLKKARKKADFVIMCPHWGTEYSLTPDKNQKAWVQLFLENGVDLVLGTHPHVIEPITWVKDKASGRKMLVYYSLGNFVNWTSGTGKGVANRMVGGMAKVTIKRKENGKVAISDWGIEPLVCHVTQGPDGVTVYPLSKYTKKLAQKNEIRKQDKNFSLEYCEKLCREVWG